MDLMSNRRELWEVIADTAREQMLARIAANPGLEQFVVGPGPRGAHCVYAARSEQHARAMHAARMEAYAIAVARDGDELVASYTWMRPEADGGGSLAGRAEGWRRAYARRARRGELKKEA